MKFIDIELKHPFACYVKTWWNLLVDGHGYKREYLKVAEKYGRSCSCKHIRSIKKIQLVHFL